MAGKSLNELELKDEALPELNYEDMPEFGSWTPPPQPGTYRFQLPGDLTKVFDVYSPGSGDLAGKQFIRVIFDSDAPLKIVQSKEPKYVGDPFQTRLSNQPRPRGKEKMLISDVDLLLRAIGVKQRPAGNKATIEVIKAQIGKEFSADISYSWMCSEERNIRVADAKGKITEVEQKGCGRKYYQEDKTSKAEQKAPRLPDGTYGDLTCSCGNVIRPFANLDNIRA